MNPIYQNYRSRGIFCPQVTAQTYYNTLGRYCDLFKEVGTGLGDSTDCIGTATEGVSQVADM